MADRNVREPAQALAQRLGRLEERVRAMSLKTWSGAVRTAEESRVEPDDPALMSQLVSVTATAGRWVVFGHTMLYVPTPAGSIRMIVELGAFNPTTGDNVSKVVTGSLVASAPAVNSPDYDFPWREWRIDPSGGSWLEPATVIGHFVTNDVVVVTMSASNVQGDLFVAYDSHLLLLPV